MLAIHNFLTTILRSREMIFALARRQLASRYMGTIGGPAWTVIQPIATVGVFWVVFSLGFKSRGPENTPFLLYFLPGYIAWLLFSEILTTSTSVIVGNAHLVKKTLFPIEILPVVNVLSASTSHLVMIFVTLGFVLSGGYSIPFALPAVLYFYAAIVVFSVGLSWITASVNVFYRDIEQVIPVLLNIWFWMTPIAWPSTLLPKEFSLMFTLNPMYYVTEGYRGALLGIPPLAARTVGSPCLWATAGFLFVAGILIFRRLKPEFPELL